jgi:hypothetical protein
MKCKVEGAFALPKHLAPAKTGFLAVPISHSLLTIRNRIGLEPFSEGLQPLPGGFASPSSHSMKLEPDGGADLGAHFAPGSTSVGFTPS